MTKTADDLTQGLSVLRVKKITMAFLCEPCAFVSDIALGLSNSGGESGRAGRAYP